MMTKQEKSILEVKSENRCCFKKMTKERQNKNFFYFTRNVIFKRVRFYPLAQQFGANDISDGIDSNQQEFPTV
jgi:hypothetical protein